MPNLTFQQFLDTEYADLYPPPEKKLVGLGWMFWGAVTVSVAAVVLAALRTAQIFYISAKLASALFLNEAGLVTEVLSLADAAAAMIAIEGGLVVYAAIRAVEHGRVKPWVYIAMITLLVLISVMAGLTQSLGLVQVATDNLVDNFVYALSIVIGAGASVVAWLSGEVLGVQLLRYQNANQEATERHERAVKGWEGRGRSAWRSYDEWRAEHPTVALVIPDDSPAPQGGTPARELARQRIAEKVFDKLASGESVDVDALAAATGRTPEFIRALAQERNA